VPHKAKRVVFYQTTGVVQKFAEIVLAQMNNVLIIIVFVYRMVLVQAKIFNGREKERKKERKREREREREKERER